MSSVVISSPRETAQARARVEKNAQTVLGSISAVRNPAMVFLAFAGLFTWLRSEELLAVDGAERCLEVYRRQTVFFHGNHHLLYPLNVFLWTRFAGALGFPLREPLSFYSTVEVMNCIAAAGCLALLAWMLFSLTRSWRWALAGSAAFGFSKAFLLSATNPNEPMVGLFWSFLGIALTAAGCRKGSSGLVALSGFVFTLAMATYQSMLLLAPAAMVLAWTNWRAEEAGGAGLLKCIHRLTSFAFGGLIGGVVIFGSAYWFSGTRSVGAMLKRFVTMEDARTYLEVTPGSLANTPIGGIRNIFPLLLEYTGIRHMLAAQQKEAFLLVLAGIALAALLVVSGVRLKTSWKQLSRAHRAATAAASTGFLFTILPVVVWSPNYEKLWLQPLACLTLLVTLALSLPTGGAKAALLISRVVPPLVLCGALANLFWAIPASAGGYSEIREPQRLAAMIGKDDFVVGGWETVSGLYAQLWALEGRYYSFPQEAALHGNQAVGRLQELIAATRARGGRVYFLDILDVTESAWSSFIGLKCGVPYSSLASYRSHSQGIATFQARSGAVSLRELNAGAPD